MKFTSSEFVRAQTGLRAQAITVATVNGTGFDKSGFAEALIVVDVGTPGGTATFDCKVQESDVVGSGYTDVTNAAFPQQTQAAGNKILVGRIDLIKRKQFLRIVVVGGGGSPTGSFSVTAQLLAAAILPVTQENTVSFNV